MSLMIEAVERGMVPDFLVRYGIRKLIKQRKNEIRDNYKFHREGILGELEKNPIAVHTDKANEQHYEVPSDFYHLVLGKNLKYSCALYEDGINDLDRAETKMLELYCERAQMKDGIDILELGCGWGSLTLFLAKKYPNSKITAISNSASQRESITNKASRLGLNNVEIITCDINNFKTEKQFDRIISIEMFEHMRNYKTLFSMMNGWLKDDGQVFIHIFCHKDATYFYETDGDDNWMGRYFFTGGIMPSFDLFERVQSSLTLKQKWKVNGINYQETSEQWFRNMDLKKKEIMPILEKTYGKSDAQRWFIRWKLFFAACAELFGYEAGQEWFVGHFLFKK